ncbi:MULTISPECIES: SurA N-terminal domain-containing protein [unclassified Virgibacillus]|uniref:SurA N-terminal domain-containing protein n=1 Tax=unclassified Virgibacillus TaxID=2620237 RepID=UPI0024DEF1CC|nr:SurA N-terminal domain-containing protein [Virgibacillus sp. LDC-1]
MKKIWIALVAGMLLLVISACGDNKDDSKNKEAAQQSKSIEISDAEKVEEDKVVVHVNDQEIKGSHYNSIYVQTKMRLHQFGQDTSDKETLKNQTLDELVAQELIKQDAEAQGVNVSEEEVKTEFDTFKAENKEQLAAYLKEYHLTEDTFKYQVKLNLILEKYVDETMQVKDVTEDEIKKTYDQLKEQNKEIPKLEEIKPTIKEQLVKQKQQEQLQAKLEKLKKNATIEKLI